MTHTPRTWLATAATAALLVCASSSLHAQTTAVTPSTATPSASAPLYQALGEKAGITSLVDDFVDRLKANARIGKMFDDIKPAYLKEQLRDQFCELSGGPCKYEGEEMKKSHEKLGIDKSQFNLLVEILQTTMDAHNISFTAQNQLLAKLAPMHREIITAH